LREIHRSFTGRNKITKTVEILGQEVLCRKFDNEIADHAWKLIEEVEELGMTKPSKREFKT
jgi:hypothetical protein